MAAPQIASPPWNPAEVQVLLNQCRFNWRQRCVLEALLQFARLDGRVFQGNGKLAELATELGPGVAATMRCRRRKTWSRLDHPYLCRILANLRRLGVVDHYWPRLGAKARWHRVLRIRIEGLRVYASWGQARGRRWRSRDGRIPDAPEPRIRSFRMRTLSNRFKGTEYPFSDGNWRYMHGPEWTTE